MEAPGARPSVAHMTTIASRTAPEGTERAELVEPWQAVIDAGHDAVLLAPEEGEVQLFEHLDKAETRPVDKEVGEASIDDYDALVLPGGVANPDNLRTHPASVNLIKGFLGAGKPIAVICHGAWLLVSAGLVKGKTMTSWPSLVPTSVSPADTVVGVRCQNRWWVVSAPSAPLIPAAIDPAPPNTRPLPSAATVGVTPLGVKLRPFTASDQLITASVGCG